MPATMQPCLEACAKEFPPPTPRPGSRPPWTPACKTRDAGATSRRANGRFAARSTRGCPSTFMLRRSKIRHPLSTTISAASSRSDYEAYLFGRRGFPDGTPAHVARALGGGHPGAPGRPRSSLSGTARRHGREGGGDHLGPSLRALLLRFALSSLQRPRALLVSSSPWGGGRRERRRLVECPRRPCTGAQSDCFRR